MIVVMDGKTSESHQQKITEKLNEMGYQVHTIKGERKIVLGVIGDAKTLSSIPFYTFDGVENVIPIEKPYKLASKEYKSSPTEIKVKDVVIGGEEIVIMAGPCAVENEKQIFQTAQLVKDAGAKILRGGAFKPRSSPYSFQGLEEEGLKLLAQAREETGLLIVTEVMSASHIELVSRYTRYISSRATCAMQNFVLLKELGKAGKPVLLKRGMAATLEELLLSAEYILSQGNSQVILCERGIRTFENHTRNTLDLSAIPAIKTMSHLPVIVDPSHGTGRRELISPMSKAAIAAGADGLIIEVHPIPKESTSDGAQTIDFTHFKNLMAEIELVAKAVGRTLMQKELSIGRGVS